jgi:hypothetical protein
LLRLWTASDHGLELRAALVPAGVTIEEKSNTAQPKLVHASGKPNSTKRIETCRQHVLEPCGIRFSLLITVKLSGYKRGTYLTENLSDISGHSGTPLGSRVHGRSENQPCYAEQSIPSRTGLTVTMRVVSKLVTDYCGRHVNIAIHQFEHSYRYADHVAATSLACKSIGITVPANDE